MPSCSRLLLALALAACLASTRADAAQPEAGAQPEATCPEGFTVLPLGSVPEEMVDAILGAFFTIGYAENTTTFARCENGTDWSIRAAGCASESEAKTYVAVALDCGADAEPTGAVIFSTLATASDGGAPQVASLEVVKPGEAATGDTVVTADGITVNKGAAQLLPLVMALAAPLVATGVMVGASCAAGNCLFG